MKVTEEDLVGQLEGFPLEVVKNMVYYQVRQGNEPNVKVFQQDKRNSKKEGGFRWEETKEGFNFWADIIVSKKFDVFFEKYPKQENDYKIHFIGGTTLDVTQAEYNNSTSERLPFINQNNILFVVKKHEDKNKI